MSVISARLLYCKLSNLGFCFKYNLVEKSLKSLVLGVLICVAFF